MQRTLGGKNLLLLCLVCFALATFGWAQTSSNDQTTSSTTTTTTTTTEKPAASQDSTTGASQDATTTDKKAKSDSDRSTSSSTMTSSEKNETDIAKRLDNAANVLTEIMGTPDKAIPGNVLADAKCVMVIPSMIHIAVGFGGRHGKGVATCRTASGWSAPAPVDLTGGSWGLQLGGEAVDLVMLVMNDKGMQHLLTSKFKIGAEASGAAGPVGRQASGDTDWKMKSEILSYSRTRGAFAGIDLNGASVKQDKDETAVMYGKVIPFTALLSGKVPAPAISKNFLSTIRKYANVAAENKTGE
jgi:lipid-binding SYLF domain-containing protein